MLSRPVALAAVALVAISAPPSPALDVFLDHNTDDDLTTFTNQVFGPDTVPIDVIVSIDEADLGMTGISVMVQWGYGGGGLGCYDVYGSIDHFPYDPLPDSGIFRNVVGYRCVCFARCLCDAELNIDATIEGLTEPGNYLLARLDFSRRGFASDCTFPVWDTAYFETFCFWPQCANPSDPRTTMLLRETATSSGEGVENLAWGRVKALYR